MKERGRVAGLRTYATAGEGDLAEEGAMAELVQADDGVVEVTGDGCRTGFAERDG